MEITRGRSSFRQTVEKGFGNWWVILLRTDPLKVE